MIIIIIGIVFFVLGVMLSRDRQMGRYAAGILIGGFAAYLYFILVITLLGRPYEGIHQTELVPLISWYHMIYEADHQYYINEILLNVVLFIPLGFLAGAIWKLKVWQAFLYGLGLSLIIEIIQYATCRGYFAWDDMLHNAVGCLLGALIVNAVMRTYRRRASNEH